MSDTINWNSGGTFQLSNNGDTYEIYIEIRRLIWGIEGKSSTSRGVLRENDNIKKNLMGYAPDSIIYI